MKEFKIRCSQIGKIMSNAKKEGELSAGCITYLKEWYSEQMFGDREEIKSKYMDKGNICENEAIDVCADQFAIFGLKKNELFLDGEFFCGTPDVITEEFIIDTKCSWSGKTFLDAVTSPLDTDYEWQLQGYMYLTAKAESRLVYVLLDTPEMGYISEVIYANPIEERFYSQTIKADFAKVEAIIAKVKKCREWLAEYDQTIKTKLGMK